ncbi:hypothetical protein [Streptomyces sp. NPDC051546]|uniref:hypothetical protein n=1 Tax=Streptomyces sp. NPDC051546 TaxID=3365655 RepID=UPI00378E9CA2
MKKFLAVAGLTLGGAALVVTTQGTAQAATAPQAVVTAEAVQAPTDAPMALGSFIGKAGKAVGKNAGKAWVHAKAACPSAAEFAGQVADHIGVSPARLPDGVSAEAVFDR